MKTDGPQQSTILFAIAILFAAVSLWSTSGFLRKNDQAAILAGANDWARGDRQDWSRYYQFDKTYVLYAYNAFFFRLHDDLNLFTDPIRLANRATASAFWLALFVFLARYRKRLDPLILLAVLASPAILLNTQYVNSSTLSSALLLLSLASLPTMPERHPWSAAAFLFLAVGSRADIVLLLPLYLWLVTPFPLSGKWGSFFFHRVEKSAKKIPLNGKTLGKISIEWKTQIWLAVAALLALLVGRLWSSAGTTLDPFFQWKMAAGYIAFGFGAAALLYVAGGLRFFRGGNKWGNGAWRWLGCAVFLLPVLFFLPQLHAPRYFWRGGEAILMLAVLGPTVWTIRSVSWRFMLGLAAVLPLLIGLHMPVWGQPRLTLTQPTVFPSGDGHYPMGAYASFLWRFRQAETEPIDHNQRVWWAAHSAEFVPDEHGAIQALFSPMGGYILLATSLQGVRAELSSFTDLQGQRFYVDSRTLARDDVKFRQSGLDTLLDGPLLPVSPEFDGIAILRTADGDSVWSQRARLLNRLFAGNEYRIATGDQPIPEGHAAIWFDSDPFSGSQQDSGTGWFYSREAAARKFVAWTALPTWMSIQQFAGEAEN